MPLEVEFKVSQSSYVTSNTAGGTLGVLMSQVGCPEERVTAGYSLVSFKLNGMIL